MSVREADFRAVLGRFATGVAVVTTMRDGHPLGITVNALSSLSLNPPLVLVCIDCNSYIHDSIRQAGYFAANLLTEDQRDLATGFAVRSERRDKEFYGVRYHPGVTGAPIFDESLGYVECRLVDVFPGGDHSIFVGEVVALNGSEQNPLLYYRARYGVYAPFETPDHLRLADSHSPISDTNGANGLSKPQAANGANEANSIHGAGKTGTLADGRAS